MSKSSDSGFPINRLVALLTPLISALAGLIVAWVAKKLPGVELAPAELTALIASVVTCLLAVAVKWLDGWQKHEQRLASTDAAPAAHTRARAA
jgi:hypothetical protein